MKWRENSNRLVLYLIMGNCLLFISRLWGGAAFELASVIVLVDGYHSLLKLKATKINNILSWIISVVLWVSNVVVISVILNLLG